MKLLQDHWYWNTFSKILDDPTRAHVTRRQNSRVLFILNDSGILSEIFEVYKITVLSLGCIAVYLGMIFLQVLDLERIVRKIFFQLVYNDHGLQKTIVPDITVTSYLENYLIFALKAKYRQRFHAFVQYIFNDDILVSNSSGTHGMHFFNTFQKPILEYLLDHGDSFVDSCISNVDKSRLDMLLVYLKYATAKGKECSMWVTAKLTAWKQFLHIYGFCCSILKYWINWKNFTSSSNEKLPDLLNMLEFAVCNMEVTSTQMTCHLCTRGSWSAFTRILLRSWLNIRFWICYRYFWNLSFAIKTITFSGEFLLGKEYVNF